MVIFAGDFNTYDEPNTSLINRQKLTQLIKGMDYIDLEK